MLQISMIENLTQANSGFYANMLVGNATAPAAQNAQFSEATDLFNAPLGAASASSSQTSTFGAGPLSWPATPPA